MAVTAGRSERSPARGTQDPRVEAQTADAAGASASGARRVVQKIAGITVGPLPLPLYLVLLAVIAAASLVGRLPADMIGGLAVIMVAGWLLGDVGLKVPILKDLGGPAILSMFVPSVAVFYHLINPAIMKSITAVVSTANLLYLFIACLVCGSILGMNRRVLIQGFVRMFIPLAVGTIAAVTAGTSVGVLCGYDVQRTFFYIIVPILGGGIGEGILPYSLAMSEILKQPQAIIVPQLVPAAMLGNVVAIVSCGLLKHFGERHARYNGHGLLVRTGGDQELLAEMNRDTRIEFPLMGAGLLLACSFFIFGGCIGKYVGIPGAIMMIFAAALVRVLNVLPARMEEGAHQMYKFVTSNLTWPLLFGLGVLYMPFKDVLAAVTPGYVAVCVTTVLSMIAAGFFVGKVMNMYEVEAAIVTGCHTGLGGTGDVAILSAADRIGLMPFAQISTRIGGAIMIVVATILLKIIIG